MKKNYSVILAALFSIVLTQEANAYVFPGDNDCPWANINHSWLDFLNKKYIGSKKSAYFSVKLNHDIGGMAGNTCYTVSHNLDGSWTTAGQIRGKNRGEATTSGGGDPMRHEINMRGTILNFNEAGELHTTDTKELIGNMYCHIGSECWK
ncbi:hypothetical protein [Methylobacterium sp. 275MFSha3.1]|uniref:hypothetical protein n=1 Tax=Methylobacterium sp. 275MFSha3.1 TaxID=1502746 RepID=UPI00111532E2|nr:hypothetical protein [Methylobacterium sp. 275MFSha3.1]